MSPFFGATNTPVLDFWWRLPWISKSGWIPHLRASSPAHNGCLIFTSGVTPANLLAASMAADHVHYMHAAEVGCRDSTHWHWLQRGKFFIKRQKRPNTWMHAWIWKVLDLAYSILPSWSNVMACWANEELYFGYITCSHVHLSQSAAFVVFFASFWNVKIHQREQLQDGGLDLVWVWGRSTHMDVLSQVPF